MKNEKKHIASNTPELYVRLCHWGFILSGILAFLTGELAEDFKSATPYGYYIHSFFGLILALVFLLYAIHFFFGKSRMQHLQWFIMDKNRIAEIKKDIKKMITLKLPAAEKHGGLAEVVQLFGLAGILLMSATGVSIFLILQTSIHIPLKPILSFHEMIKAVVLMYLIIHVGAAVMHTLAGHRVLGNIFSLKRK